MSKQQATSDYIKVEDLPESARGRPPSLPWEQWAKIPEGMALEIDCDGRVPKTVANSLGCSLRRKPERGLGAMKRKERVFVVRLRPQP